MEKGVEKLKLSNQMKVNIIVCLIGFIFVGYFTAKHYIRVTNCIESSRDGLLYDKDLCYRNIDNNQEVLGAIQARYERCKV